MEFGLFSDEGLVEGGFLARGDAEAALARYSKDDGLVVRLVEDDEDDEDVEDDDA